MWEVITMELDAKFFMHDSDKKALQALQSIPGFTQVFKAFMKVWSEKQFRIINMSTNLRISNRQMSKYYNMLVPICAKLGIPVPELYLELDVNANAYTAGDTEPFIVITSGLLETVPEYLIPTVLAHECGHIVCHHCLYTTMGRVILSEAINALGLSELAIMPIQVAFSYWMRCSELSADRVAAICDGTSDKVAELCMRFAGYDKDIDAEADVEEFMNQAREYLDMVQDSTWNKTMEFLIFGEADHPMNAVRAYECVHWCENTRFRKICRYLDQSKENETTALSMYLQEIPMTESSKQYIGKNFEEVCQLLKDQGFQNISISKITQKGMMTKDGEVINIRVDDKDGFDAYEWYSINASIVIEYYEHETEEEIAAAHPGQLRTPDSAKHCIGKTYTEVFEEFKAVGFLNIELVEYRKEKKSWLIRNNAVNQISINGQTQFAKGEWFDQAANIRIVYYAINKDQSAI